MVPSVKILMADDDPDDLELVQQVIREVLPSVELLAFPDGQPMLEYLNACREADLPHLIVLDYNMPYTTGVEVLARLKGIQRFSAIPKVILSTSDAPMYVEKSLHNGATAYFVKPVSLQELRKLAKRLLKFCGIACNG